MTGTELPKVANNTAANAIPGKAIKISIKRMIISLPHFSDVAAVAPKTPVAPVAEANQVGTAVRNTTPFPTATQDVKTPVAQETVVPSTENPAAAVPTIETASVAKAPSETRVVRGGDKKSESVVKHDKDVKNTKKAAVDKAPKVKVVKDEKKADKEEPTKEEKKTLKVENHNLAQPTSKKA